MLKIIFWLIVIGFFGYLIFCKVLDQDLLIETPERVNKVDNNEVKVCYLKYVSEGSFNPRYRIRLYKYLRAWEIYESTGELSEVLTKF